MFVTVPMLSGIMDMRLPVQEGIFLDADIIRQEMLNAMHRHIFFLPEKHSGM